LQRGAKQIVAHRVQSRAWQFGYWLGLCRWPLTKPGAGGDDLLNDFIASRA
jgi:hypothetical protein